MLFDLLFKSNMDFELESSGDTAITVFCAEDESYIKLLCWPNSADFDDYTMKDIRNLTFALFIQEAFKRQEDGHPFSNFIPILDLEQGIIDTRTFATSLNILRDGSGNWTIPPENLHMVDSWSYVIYQTPGVDTDWEYYLDKAPRWDDDSLFAAFCYDVMRALPVVLADLRVENFGFVPQLDDYLLYVFDCDVYWTKPFGLLTEDLWLKSNLFQLERCHLDLKKYPKQVLGTPLYDEICKAWGDESREIPFGLTRVEKEHFMNEALTCMRNTYNRMRTTFGAEEVKDVKQYPVMYKKTATGTLQQWQVLLIPQEEGGYLLTTESGKVDGAINRGKGKLISEGKVNRTALEQAELEANSKFKKKQDSGYFPTQEEARENLVLLPMLALNFEKRSHDIRYPAVAQRKFDGVRCLAITQPDGTVRLMTRKGKDFPHLNHLRRQIEALDIEPNMVLDGEVYSDSITFQEATGLVRRETLKPGDEEKMAQIDYRLYDAILLDNPEATFLDRYAKLAALFPAQSVGLRRVENLILTENFPLRGPEDLMALHTQFTKDEDFEGVMIRNLHGTYDLNKRSKHLQKFKTFQDDEYEIVGYDEASGNDQGTVVWIVKTAAGQEFRVRPEGTRELRREWFEDGDDYIGKMLTVKFFELTDDGIPRFPIGIAIRDYE